MTTKLERQDSVISILSSSGIDLCRICHCDSGDLISPCYCSGSMRWVHQGCLQHWIRASNNRACELCRHPYILRAKLKPPCSWEFFPMTSSEKRRLFCSALFHMIALSCVIWSLYVLIDRTVEEVYQSELEWQFWTKIVVEAIGCLGAGILIYVWGKSYFAIVNKFIAFNRTFIIVNSAPQPEKIPLPSSPSANPPCGRSSSKCGSVMSASREESNGGGKRPSTPSSVSPPPPPPPPPQYQAHSEDCSEVASGSSSPLMMKEVNNKSGDSGGRTTTTHCCSCTCGKSVRDSEEDPPSTISERDKLVNRAKTFLLPSPQLPSMHKGSGSNLSVGGDPETTTNSNSRSATPACSSPSYKNNA